MAQSTKDDYSHQQDVEQLNQTLISLKERYGDNRRAGIVSENEAEFWAYRLILAPIYANTQLENELHRLPSDLRNNPRVKTALEIFRVLKAIIIHRNYDNFVQCQSNWKVFWDLIKSPRVSYLMACAAAICFNRVRHVVLDSVWRAYRVGQYRHQVSVEEWTTGKLREVLGMDTDSEAVQFCEAHGFVFEVNEAGQTFLDIKQKSYERKAVVLPKADVKPQFFSASIVEAKRHDRPLSAVIAGLTVQEAKKGGFSFNNAFTDQVGQAEDQTSLFIPEKPNIFSQQSNGSKPLGGGFNLNPTASPFQSSSAPAGSPNPFAKAPQSGVFDLSKNPIKFASPAETNTNPFLQQNNSSPFQSAPLAPSTNPFLKNNTTPSQPTMSAAPSNPFLPSAFTAAQSKSQPQDSTLKHEPVPSDEASKPAPAFNFTTAGFNFAPSQEISEPAVSSTPAGSFSTTPAGSFSFTPAGSPPQEDTSAQEAEAEAQRAEKARLEAAEKQRREDEARQRVQEAQRAKQAKEEERKREAAAAAERQRKEQVERERRAREEQEELARQARQRQAQEEEARAKRLREMDLALRTLTSDVMFDPQEGLLMQFIENAVINISNEAAKSVEMERRVALVDRKYENYLVELKRAGLAKIMAAVQKKKRMQKAKERRRRLKEKRIRTMSMGEKEHTDASVLGQTVALNGEAGPTSQPNGYAAPQQRSSNTRRAKRTEERRSVQVSEAINTTNPDATPNNPGPRTTGRSHNNPPNTNTTKESSSALNYSEAYRQAAATAPVDRTETDWFKLRAMGIDPSKHRKRSFDFTSSDEEKPKLIESKRPKLLSNSPSVESQLPPTPKTMDEEQVDRAEAIKRSFKGSTYTISPSQSINGAASISGRASFNDSTSSLIERARRIVAGAKSEMPPPPHTNSAMSVYRADSFEGNASQLIARAKGLGGRYDTTSNVQHDWSRSVPNLGFSASQSQRSMYGNSSFGSTVSTKDRPAYWGRTSRFVPRHLYGRGADAVRAYRVEQGLSKSPSSTRPASTEPMSFSSPIPTQQSFVQHAQAQIQGYTQEQYSDIEEASGVDVVDIDAEDSNAVMTDDEEFVGATSSYPGSQFPAAQPDHQDYDEDADSEMLEGEDDDELLDYDEYDEVDEDEEIVDNFDEEEEEEEEEDESEEEDDNGGENTMKPGATEDDAIELSD